MATLASMPALPIHVYRATRSMERRVFYDADGELLIVPQQGRLLLRTEFGLVEAGPGEIAVIPRGVKFARRIAGRPRPAAMSAKITANCCGCPNWGRSAPTGSPTRVTF